LVCGLIFRRCGSLCGVLLGACLFPSVELNVILKFSPRNRTLDSWSRRSAIIDRPDLFNWPQGSVLWLIVHVLAAGIRQNRHKDEKNENPGSIEK